MVSILPATRAQDLREMFKAVIVFHFKGQLGGSYTEIAQDLAAISQSQGRVIPP